MLTASNIVCLLIAAIILYCTIVPEPSERQTEIQKKEIPDYLKYDYSDNAKATKPKFDKEAHRKQVQSWCKKRHPKAGLFTKLEEEFDNFIGDKEFKQDKNKDKDPKNAFLDRYFYNDNYYDPKTQDAQARKTIFLETFKAKKDFKRTVSDLREIEYAEIEKECAMQEQSFSVPIWFKICLLFLGTALMYFWTEN